MNTANIKNVTATGDVTTATAALFSVTLTGGSDAATLTVKAGGSGGTTILVVKAAASTTVAVPLNAGVPCSGGIHATLTGTAPSAAFVYS